ncbi:MAG: SDR family oxidoreductase, partial [Elusimicrobia bacterium]|nr:SDR family oxidoreductase [Elusimicrobiota bacterium]
GGQGIGKGIAKRFVEAGWRVVLAEKDAAAGRETEQELGPDARFVRTDTSSERSVVSLFRAVRGFGGGLDALVNNAGLSEFKPLERATLADWNRVIGTNLTGYFLCAKYAAPLLRKNGGAIVNIASTRALMSEPGNEAYSASKGGIVGLTQALAISLGPAVRANCISPGWIDISLWQKSGHRRPAPLRAVDHKQHPVGRVGRLEDIAELALYLCSPVSGFMTGTNIVIDGGMVRKMIYA